MLLRLLVMFRVMPWTSEMLQDGIPPWLIIETLRGLTLHGTPEAIAETQTIFECQQTGKRVNLSWTIKWINLNRTRQEARKKMHSLLDTSVAPRHIERYCVEYGI
jgi:hypothetical protein